MGRKYYIQAISSLGRKIHTTKEYWNYIVHEKHPEIRGKKREAIETIEKPAIIKQSSVDAGIFVYYRKIGDKYFCIVTREAVEEGFIITAYITRKFVEGEIVYQENTNDKDKKD